MGNEFDLEYEHRINHVMNDDIVCQLEFDRFFEVSMGTKRANKYLSLFRKLQCNDIRLVDPCIFDSHWFDSKELTMNNLDKKLLQREVAKYYADCIKFERILVELNMAE